MRLKEVADFTAHDTMIYNPNLPLQEKNNEILEYNNEVMLCYKPTSMIDFTSL